MKICSFGPKMLNSDGPPGRTRHRLMDNIKVHLKEGSSEMEWIDL